jgi:hypothetical protein
MKNTLEQENALSNTPPTVWRHGCGRGGAMANLESCLPCVAVALERFSIYEQAVPFTSLACGGYADAALHLARIYFPQ